MALSSSEQILEALTAALDQVPLTAEQRQKILYEFSLRIGQPVGLPLAPVLPSLMPSPVADAKVALQAALNQALESAHTEAQPIHPDDRTAIQADLMKRLQDRLGANDASVDRSAVQAIVRQTLVHESKRNCLSFGGGVTFALIESVLLSAILTAVILIGFGTGLLGQPLYLTIADIFIVILGLQLLGSAHEAIWFSKPMFFNIVTLIRGAVAPLTIVLGGLLFLHERLWRQYSQNKFTRIGWAVMSPLSVPVGLVWNATGFVIRKIEGLIPKNTVHKNTDSSLIEEKKSDPMVAISTASAKPA